MERQGRSLLSRGRDVFEGEWAVVFLYRAIDKQGQLIDSMLSAKRDRTAAQRFFRSAQTVAGRRAEQVTTDGHNAYPRAVAEVLGEKVKHRCRRYKNNQIQQDHRGIKQRYFSTLGFKSFRSSKRFCQWFDELRNYFRPHRSLNQFVPCGKQRQRFLSQLSALQIAFITP